MRAQPVLAREREHGVDALQRPHAASAEVGCLLYRDHARARRVAIAYWAKGALELLDREDAALAIQRPHHRPRELRGSAGLGRDWVRRAVEDQLVAAGPHVQAQGDLVAHRAARQKHRRLVSEQARHALLQPARVTLVAWVRSGDAPASQAWRERLALAERWQPPRFPLGGADVMALGVPAGPRVGELLGALERIDGWLRGQPIGGRVEVGNPRFR